ncbi:2,3,4,5-tetrahydropyridine-2,6-carboxylate N-succinyltransferase [Candidatus Paracaedimonas acanthamoebae]|nr:2,3,4,5-tetrahydropyridine-2,6-carboxylate N-succinyltransferase [Candidatus Paracaedimonas acanthamoebae]
MIALQTIIEQAWEDRTLLNPASASQDLQEAISATLAALDTGESRIAEKIDGDWHIHQWLKKAILLSFRIRPNLALSEGIGGSYDKVPLKYGTWQEEEFKAANFRAVPGAIVRHSAYVGPDVILMPSFVNVGAYIGAGTMVDSWATIGSCAQIGEKCHISANVLIGGVLEPLQADPVIIEDNCFIGAGSSVAEGLIIEQGAILGMGVSISASTPIVDRTSGEVSYGRIPTYSVVVSGSLPPRVPTSHDLQPHLNCAVIVKTVDEKTRNKTAINELLRAV